MKQGDKIQPKPGVVGIAEDERTISYISDLHVLYRPKRDDVERHLPRSVFDERFELVPDFFEEGARYERGDYGARFSVEAVRTDEDGTRVAFGMMSPRGGRSYWTTRRAFSGTRFEGWRKL